jgi:hypothetical protein
MAVDVRTAGNSLEAGIPRLLFQTTAIGTYAVTADGQRFLINARVEQMASSPLTVVINWHAGLKK